MDQDSMYRGAEARWDAVVRRDTRADGAFYFAVKTTGVFCRPGCKSRAPRRDNVVFFETSADAQAAGYRPCKRCAPDGEPTALQHARAMREACRRIEASDATVTLEELAHDAGLSRWHFQRVFKSIIGVSPKQYALAYRARRLRDNLRSAETVTDAIYDAGYGSASRAYESINGRLAMKPSVYRNGAHGISMRYSIAPCSLGWVSVAVTERGVCAIEFDDDPATLSERLRRDFPRAEIEEGGADLSSYVHHVVAFVDAPATGLDLPLDILGTAFQQRVWHALREVPAGDTISYTEIAERIGEPRAIRAVAQACAANKLAVAVPCHRVVRKDGDLSGYRWGIERKRLLLERERDGEDCVRHQERLAD